jgi:hypothetical protein
MYRSLSLATYVKKRNGVALGAAHSMRNMLFRSLGAGSFATFWHYWNPIWGFYLAKFVMRPLSYHLPSWLALILTFTVSGALHDIAVSLVKWQSVFMFTPWFFLMGAWVVLSGYFSISYAGVGWVFRAMLNILQIASCFIIVRYLLDFGGTMPNV